jgi:hypothetical protein
MSNPLGSIGDLSKPATVLVEKISEAVGGIFRPYQMVRVAKAEAEVDRIRAESEIQITEVHRARGINCGSLVHLESLGLIRFDSIAGFARMRLPKGGLVRYFGRAVPIEFSKDADNELELDHVLFTQAGSELCRVSGSSPDDNFFQYVYDGWAERSLVPRPSTTQQPSIPEGISG